MKLVTIYIITCNRSALLKRAIESAVAQTYKNTEIIVVDDASNDDTEEAVLSLQAQHHIRYYRNKTRMGACFSRNIAIKEAKGELITGLDDDDYFSPSRVEDLVDAYKEKYAFVCANIIEVTNRGEFNRRFGFKKGEFDIDKLLHQNLVGNQVLTSTKKLRAIEGFDENLPAFQDYDTWVRLLDEFKLGYKISRNNYYLNTEHFGERISSSSERKTQGFKIFYEKHKAKMLPCHKKSMKIIRYKVTNEKMSFLSMIKLISLNNYKSALSLFLSQRRR